MVGVLPLGNVKKELPQDLMLAIAVVPLGTGMNASIVTASLIVVLV